MYHKSSKYIYESMNCDRKLQFVGQCGRNGRCMRSWGLLRDVWCCETCWEIYGVMGPFGRYMVSWGLLGDVCVMEPLGDVWCHWAFWEIYGIMGPVGRCMCHGAFWEMYGVMGPVGRCGVMVLVGRCMVSWGLLGDVWCNGVCWDIYVWCHGACWEIYGVMGLVGRCMVLWGFLVITQRLNIVVIDYWSWRWGKWPRTPAWTKPSAISWCQMFSYATRYIWEDKVDQKKAGENETNHQHGDTGQVNGILGR